MTVSNQIGDFVDMNELPLVIDYEDKVVRNNDVIPCSIDNQSYL